MIIIDEYKKSLKMLETEEWFDTYFYRIFAFIFVKSVYRTSITPNGITYLSLVFGVLAGFCLAVNQLILGGVLFIISNILDCADGQLARVRGGGSPLGRLLDGIIDYVVYICVYFGIAINLSTASQCSWCDNAWIVFVVGLLAGGSNIFQAMFFDQFRQEFQYNMGKSTSTPEHEQTIAKDAYQSANGFWAVFKKIPYWLAIQYLQSQINFHKRMENKNISVDVDYYYANNKIMLRLWSFLGSSMHITLIVIMAFINKIDLYFLIVIVPMNIHMVIIYLLQKYHVNKKIANNEKIKNGC